jgi:hypothetical protein
MEVEVREVSISWPLSSAPQSILSSLSRLGHRTDHRLSLEGTRRCLEVKRQYERFW